MKNKKLQLFIVILISALGLYIAFRGIEWKNFVSELKSINLYWYIGGMVAMLVILFIRALRWRILLLPMGNYSTVKLYKGTIAGFFTNPNASIPAYYPSEMLLIKAEAALRQEQLPTAIGYINQVRTKTATEDPLGIGAGLTDYSGEETVSAIEEEIYRQRSAELYLTGMRFEDSRRLNRPGPPDNLDERNRNFYPYPLQERQNNPNTPVDPIY
jgi:hypothetical protein